MNNTLQPKQGEWCVSEEMNAAEDDFVYVNMNDNKESFTAYNGSQVWNALYSDNCMMDEIDQFNPKENCRAETLLFQAVSGLHASVNMHVSSRYVDLKTNE